MCKKVHNYWSILVSFFFIGLPISFIIFLSSKPVVTSLLSFVFGLVAIIFHNKKVSNLEDNKKMIFSIIGLFWGIVIVLVFNYFFEFKKTKHDQYVDYWTEEFYKSIKVMEKDKLLYFKLFHFNNDTTNLKLQIRFNVTYYLYERILHYEDSSFIIEAMDKSVLRSDELIEYNEAYDEFFEKSNSK